MLFRTVYGVELEVIYQYICRWPDGRTRQEVVTTFIPAISNLEQTASAQNIEDALSFLVSSYLLEESDGKFVPIITKLPFKLSLLHNLRRLELGTLAPKHPLDNVYLKLLDAMFILPDILLADKLHTQVNTVPEIKQQGGVSREKVQSWRRVMEYIGLGYRIQSGFMALVSPMLIQQIVSSMAADSSTLQEFFEQFFTRFLPYANQAGDIAQAIRQPMFYLAQLGTISLTSLQDSPSKAYFQPNYLRQITRMSTDVSS